MFTYICVIKCLHIEMETRRDVFQAIADPTRREIIDLLAQKPMNLNAISEEFDITRPAISNHIRILNECGIVQIEQIGRERICRIQPDQLRQVSDWIGKYETLWLEKIDSFEKYLYDLKSKRKKHGRK
jgi:DNA-binding transcriptional ArsR family regulator